MVPKWVSGVKEVTSRGVLVVLRKYTRQCFFLRGTNSLKTSSLCHGIRAKVRLFPWSSQVMAMCLCSVSCFPFQLCSVLCSIFHSMERVCAGWKIRRTGV